MGYPDSPKECSVTPVTITEQLEQNKRRLEAQLVVVNDALTGLKSNPEIERVLNLVAKANRC